MKLGDPRSEDLLISSKLKVFRSSALALNQIGNLEIPFNSFKLIFLDVNARYWLRILDQYLFLGNRARNR